MSVNLKTKSAESKPQSSQHDYIFCQVSTPSCIRDSFSKTFPYICELGVDTVVTVFQLITKGQQGVNAQS